MKDASGGGTMALTGWGEGQEPAVVPGLLIAALDAAYQQGQIDNEGVYHSLRAKLTQAQDDINQGQRDKAVQELEAFVNEVEAQRGKHVTEEAADRLIALAQRLIAQLQGETPPPIPDPRSAIQNPPASITYTYDDLYRLTGAEYSTGESFAYTYDAVGNRLQLTRDGGQVTNYAYDAADRLTSVNGVGYTWDDNGNLLSDGVRTYSYDAADRLIAVSGQPSAVSYTYNGDGLLVGRTVDSVGTTFTWDVAASLPQVLATSDGAAYLYGLSLLAQQQSGAWQYPLPDGLGSLRQWADVGGQVTYAARYAPFGSLLWQQGTAPGPWGFAGEMQDPTGLL
jgi:YD repeat-containing protein